ncbi:MAG TPA: glycosyltransferase [Actinomycetes bacterium]|jgi:glycosyltransferase involved in cell wall biosynthesis|nr:glycosyltransferase [Actinomycetes bacterium]
MTAGPSSPHPAVLDLVAERQAARERRDFARADALREQVRAEGWLIRDTAAGAELMPAPEWEPLDPATVRPRWDEPDRHEVSVIVHVLGWPEDVRRAVASLAAHCGATDYDVVLVDDGTGTEVGRALEDLAAADPTVTVLHLDTPVGFGAAMNLGMGQATGRVLVWLDPHVEATGDVLGPLLAALAEPQAGLTGGWGVVSHSMLDFEADDGPEVDAIEGYLLAVPRRIAARVPLDPKHRYYRNADLDFSFAVRDLPGGSGPLRALRVDVPAERHRHRAYHETDPAQRDRASKKNYDRFLARWKDRTDLLTRGFTGYHRHH